MSTDVTQSLAALEQWAPRIGVLSASGDSALERAYRMALRQRRIPCIQFIDIWANYALRFHSGPESGEQPDFPDIALTIDDAARRGMIADGIPASIIHVIGQPYFEALRTSSREARTTGDAGPTRVLIATQPVSRYHGRRLGYDEHDFLHCCLDAWRRRAANWDQVDVAIHPEEARDCHLATLAHYSGRIRVVEGDALQLDRYAAVLGMYSSLLVHALLADTPAASVQPGTGANDSCQFSALGMIPRWTEVAQLSDWLDNATDFHTSRKMETPPVVNLLLRNLAGSCDRFEQFLLAHRS